MLNASYRTTIELLVFAASKLQKRQIIKKPKLFKKVVNKKPKLVSKLKIKQKIVNNKVKPNIVDKKAKLAAKEKWWSGLSLHEQKAYLKVHPKSKLKLKKDVRVDTKQPKNKKSKNNNKSNSKKSNKITIKNQEGDEKTIKLKPLTKDKSTTELFKVDNDAVNAASAEEHQKIHKIIEEATSNIEDNEDTNKPEENKEDKNSKEENNEEKDIDDKINSQLHPKQKLGFIKAARVLISKKASKEDKAEAVKSLGQLHALGTLTKIAGAASATALAYYLGSSTGAQLATYFALHRGQHIISTPEAQHFLRKWANKRFVGEEKENNSDHFDKLLGVLHHKADKNHGNNNHKTHYNSHHKKH